MRRSDEDLIDFPVSDLWRDHYAAQGMTYPSGKKPQPHPEQSRGYSDADSEPWQHVQDLIASLNKKQAEIERLKSQAHHHTDSRDSFEGVE